MYDPLALLDHCCHLMKSSAAFDSSAQILSLHSKCSVRRLAGQSSSDPGCRRLRCSQNYCWN